jgi:hypothetical protein
MARQRSEYNRTGNASPMHSHHQHSHHLHSSPQGHGPQQLRPIQTTNSPPQTCDSQQYSTPTESDPPQPQQPYPQRSPYPASLSAHHPEGKTKSPSLPNAQSSPVPARRTQQRTASDPSIRVGQGRGGEERPVHGRLNGVWEEDSQDEGRRWMPEADENGARMSSEHANNNSPYRHYPSASNGGRGEPPPRPLPPSKGLYSPDANASASGFAPPLHPGPSPPHTTIQSKRRPSASRGSSSPLNSTFSALHNDPSPPTSPHYPQHQQQLPQGSYQPRASYEQPMPRRSFSAGAEEGLRGSPLGMRRNDSSGTTGSGGGSAKKLAGIAEKEGKGSKTLTPKKSLGGLRSLFGKKKDSNSSLSSNNSNSNSTLPPLPSPTGSSPTGSQRTPVIGCQRELRHEASSSSILSTPSKFSSSRPRPSLEQTASSFSGSISFSPSTRVVSATYTTNGLPSSTSISSASSSRPPPPTPALGQPLPPLTPSSATSPRAPFRPTPPSQYLPNASASSTTPPLSSFSPSPNRTMPIQRLRSGSDLSGSSSSSSLSRNAVSPPRRSGSLSRPSEEEPEGRSASDDDSAEGLPSQSMQRELPHLKSSGSLKLLSLPSFGFGDGLLFGGGEEEAASPSQRPSPRNAPAVEAERTRTDTVSKEPANWSIPELSKSSGDWKLDFISPPPSSSQIAAFPQPPSGSTQQQQPPQALSDLQSSPRTLSQSRSRPDLKIVVKPYPSSHRPHSHYRELSAASSISIDTESPSASISTHTTQPLQVRRRVTPPSTIASSSASSFDAATSNIDRTSEINAGDSSLYSPPLEISPQKTASRHGRTDSDASFTSFVRKIDRVGRGGSSVPDGLGSVSETGEGGSTQQQQAHKPIQDKKEVRRAERVVRVDEVRGKLLNVRAIEGNGNVGHLEDLAEKLGDCLQTFVPPLPFLRNRVAFQHPC